MDSNFVGALTEDIAILSADDDAPVESDVSEPSSFSGTEATDRQDANAKTDEESHPQHTDDNLLDKSHLSPTAQNFEPPSEQENSALNDGLAEFCVAEITEALPQLRPMDAGEKEQIIGKVNFGIFQEIYADKRFMASLAKSYDGSRQSLQRGATLLAEKWLRALPHAISKLELPKPLTQSESDRMHPMEVLSSKRFGQARGMGRRSATASRAEILRSRVPFREILDGALQVRE